MRITEQVGDVVLRHSRKHFIPVLRHAAEHLVHKLLNSRLPKRKKLCSFRAKKLIPSAQITSQRVQSGQ